jgi:hypothetical protein
MKQVEQYEQDLASIRMAMERSAKFISLSGLSGILAGTYPLGGAVTAYFILDNPISITEYAHVSIQQPAVVAQLLGIAVTVLIASIATGIFLSTKKAKKHSATIWNETSKRLAINLTIPLFTGGIFILILLNNGHYGIIASACLLFYGLAIVNVSGHLFEEIRYLGYSEIVLGLIAAAVPGYGLLFWALGFGVLHIFYGALMYRKYDR